MIYEQPEMEVIKINAEVIVVVSGGSYDTGGDSGENGNGGGGTEGDADGEW